MIFTALSFLHYIYGLFLMRRKCQLDYMLNGHWSTQDSGREGVILSLCYLSVSLCNPLSNIQFWIWNFYLIIFIAAHVITRLLLWELAFDWMELHFTWDFMLDLVASISHRLIVDLDSYGLSPEAYSQPSQISKMERFSRFNCFQPWTILSKQSIWDVWQDSEYTFDHCGITSETINQIS